jgi:hypothetical protein
MVRSECCGETDIWQIKVSSQVLFEDIELDWGITEDYVEGVATENGSWRIPSAIRSYLENKQPEITRDLYGKGI